MAANVDQKEYNSNDKEEAKQGPKKPGWQFWQYLYSCEKYNIVSIVIAVIATAIILIIGIDECKTCFERLSKVSFENQQLSTKRSNTKKYWAYGRNVESGFLSNLFEVLERVGYENVANTSDWDLLWAHDYPFQKLYSVLNNLKPHQKVNHFPGCGYITNKVDLATSNLKYIPPAFKLPDQKEALLKHLGEKESVQFVQKNNDHRHIKLKNISDINLDEANGTFVQEYISSPYLVSGYKFDIGIYTIITSVNPLRVYIYNGDALLRFCPAKYYPFDPQDINKYVVGDDYLPTWEVPGLKYYYNTLGFGMKESLNAYIRAEGKNPNVIWEQIIEAISIVTLNKESKIVDVVRKFKSKHNFFEMMRFDFVVDEHLRVYLMEANMSPNLSSAHFPPNKLLFEQVIYNLLSVVGVAVRTSKNTLARSEEEMHMETADKNIAVYPEECNNNICKTSCQPVMCQLCKNCLTAEDRLDLLRAHNEHLNKADCKRIFPPPMNTSIEIAINFAEYSPKNQMMYKWFLGKCILDESWCK
ncbi:hypothetical protein MML48_2g00009199 [Holotrichia oblita]|uniref:Uncharacterized protein n=1 Tax=Holotrichia oblita TaxID=644536 RepID=A0ACB9TN90_HOLOL|nr:hypothetical protein MML48_2g00009199 [Holotrichia oblita]